LPLVSKETQWLSEWRSWGRATATVVVVGARRPRVRPRGCRDAACRRRAAAASRVGSATHRPPSSPVRAAPLARTTTVLQRHARRAAGGTVPAWRTRRQALSLCLSVSLSRRGNRESVCTKQGLRGHRTPARVKMLLKLATTMMKTPTTARMSATICAAPASVRAWREGEARGALAVDASWRTDTCANRKGQATSSRVLWIPLRPQSSTLCPSPHECCRGSGSFTAAHQCQCP
jgi:hypothetical protein